jgi:hypothetical protein
MKFVTPSHLTDPDAAARKLVQIADAVEAEAFRNNPAPRHAISDHNPCVRRPPKSLAVDSVDSHNCHETAPLETRSSLKRERETN